MTTLRPYPEGFGKFRKIHEWQLQPLDFHQIVNLFEIGVACDDSGFLSLSRGDCKGIGIGDRILRFDCGSLNHFVERIANRGYGKAGQDGVQEIFCSFTTTLSCEDIESFADVDIIHQDSDLIRVVDLLHFLIAFFAF